MQYVCIEGSHRRVGGTVGDKKKVAQKDKLTEVILVMFGTCYVMRDAQLQNQSYWCCPSRVRRSFSLKAKISENKPIFFSL
jgi:hypothetical protein